MVIMFDRIGLQAPKFCRRAAVIIATGALAATGCSGPSDGDQIDVVASVYPYAYVAQEILGSHGKVVDLSANAGDAHDVELSPKQVGAIKQADLVIHQSGFQAPIDETIEQNKPKHEIDVTKIVEFIEFDDHSGHDHEAGHEHSGADHGHKDGAGHDHKHEGNDPHVWLDIRQLRKVAVEVSKQLSANHPQYQDEFEHNAKQLDDKLAKLDDDMTSGLSSCEIDHVIVNHAAFGYLGHRYGFHQVGISGLEPELEPSPTQIKQASEAATEYGVTTIFYETGVSDRVAKSIARDLGLKAAVLNPLESLASDDKSQDYETIMRQNLDQLREANKCR